MVRSGILALAALLPAAVHADAARDALIAAMNDSDCTLTTAEASEVLPALGISRPQAIALSRQLFQDGLAKFADDEETLVLLPPACTK